VKAYLLDKIGKPEVLKIKEVPDPNPASNEVKVRVETIGLNYAEVLSRRGQYSWAPKRPYIPGMEVYGEVVAVGGDVTRFKEGQKVIAGNQYGGYATYTCVPEHLIFPANESVSPEENAALLVCFMTAWVALRNQARVVSGEKVLVQAAAGGVGTAAVQLAKAMGAEVIGTASRPEKIELIKSLGADHAINYAEEDFQSVIEKKYGTVDAVLEVVGGDVYKKSVKLLGPFGRVVVIGFASISFNKWKPWTWWKTWRDAPKVNVMNMAQNSYGISASHIGYLTENVELSQILWEELSSFVTEHNIKPHVGKVFNFNQMPEAHAFMESRRSTGKIVIKGDGIE